MAISQKSIDLIKHYESLHDGDLSKIGIQPKMDPLGIWTIGWGHAIFDPISGRFVKEAANKKRAEELFPDFNLQQAEDLLKRDLSTYEIEVRKLVPGTLNDDQIGALVAFSYNVGVAAFKSSSALVAINKGDIKLAGDKLLLWNKGTVNGVKVELKGLTYRRMSERDLLVSGTLKYYNV
ncbi:MAG: lysozyme [Bacteroidia bacterium]|nr:lysozyme [Bacteroidia bacterium]